MHDSGLRVGVPVYHPPETLQESLALFYIMMNTSEYSSSLTLFPTDVAGELIMWVPEEFGFRVQGFQASFNPCRCFFRVRKLVERSSWLCQSRVRMRLRGAHEPAGDKGILITPTL